MAEFFALVLAILVGTTVVAAGIFSLVWATLGQRMPFLAGLVCLVIGLSALIIAASTNWFGLGELGLGLLVVGAVAGPAVLGIIFMAKGARAGLRRSGPGMREAVTTLRKDFFGER